MNSSLQVIIRNATKRIPPLWPLKHFVAVNPFIGLTERHFVEAAELIQKAGHGEMLMPKSFYRDQIAAGRIREADVHAALAIAKKTLLPEFVEPLNSVGWNELNQALEAPESQPAWKVLTFADFLDSRHQTAWAAFVVEEISKWCSAYFDQGQSSWRMPWRQLGLFAAWKAAAKLDINPELTGLKRFRKFTASLPGEPLEVIRLALEKLCVPEMGQADFLHRQLMSVHGWSSHIQYLVREEHRAGRADDSLSQLLAIRLAYDLALWEQFGNEGISLGDWHDCVSHLQPFPKQISAELLTRFIAQQALEHAYQSELITKLKRRTLAPAESARPKALQAVFCIDVRSEVYRRALEMQSDEISTSGFAGFFGVAIDYLKFGKVKGEAHAPVLLSPKYKIREMLCPAGSDAQKRAVRHFHRRQTVNSAWNGFKTSAISCFSFVETAGLWFGVSLAKGLFGWGVPDFGFATQSGRLRFAPHIGHEICSAERHGSNTETGIPEPDQIELATSALKNMGMVSDFAKVVLFCAHGSATANNPYGSALDCGACGGHAGDANARVAAAILNQAFVRRGLEKRGIHIPDETVFIAGVHNTTTDEVLIYTDENASSSQAEAIEKIRPWLSAASKQARRERASSLGLQGAAEGELDQEFFARSGDWSQIRPEWGLAGNAAFIAAPRARTKGLNLGGRTFLHDYEAALDPEKTTLELILSAPMVVANWINLQYYGSAVDNELFGSGNKVLHNVVGTMGVWQGNGGDLQAGLPIQSVHDGTRLIHEPLRLSVFIEAACADIEKALSKHPSVEDLIINGWVHLFAIEECGTRIYRYTGTQFEEEQNAGK